MFWSLPSFGPLLYCYPTKLLLCMSMWPVLAKVGTWIRHNPGSAVVQCLVVELATGHEWNRFIHNLLRRFPILFPMYPQTPFQNCLRGSENSLLLLLRNMRPPCYHLKIMLTRYVKQGVPVLALSNNVYPLHQTTCTRFVKQRVPSMSNNVYPLCQTRLY